MPWRKRAGSERPAKGKGGSDLTKFDLERIKAAAFDILSVSAVSQTELGGMMEAMCLLIRVLEAEQELRQ